MKTRTGSPVLVALGVCLSLVIAACGGGAGPSSTIAGIGASPGASQPPGASGDPGRSDDPAAGAALSVSATGAPAACKSFATLKFGCAAYLKLQMTGSKTVADLPFPGNPVTDKIIRAGDDWPLTLAPGTWRVTAHLDRVGTTGELPPATPDHWVDRSCRATIVIGPATTAVLIKVNFGLDRACKVTSTIEPEDSGVTPKPTKKPKKTPAP